MVILNFANNALNCSFKTCNGINKLKQLSQYQCHCEAQIIITHFNNIRRACQPAVTKRIVIDFIIRNKD